MATVNRCNENKLTCHNKNHTNDVFRVMEKMRNDLDFCDVFLVADDVEIPANKMILAAASPYFYTMFMNFKESNQPKVTINGINYQILSLIINYIYTSKITVDNENSLALAGNFLQIEYVVDACMDFLKNELLATNCLELKAFAELHGFQDFLKEAITYITKNFADVIKSEEFSSLSFDEYFKLISNDLTNVPVASIFQSMIIWIKHDLTSRQKYLKNFINYVHVHSPQKNLSKLFQQIILLEEDPQSKSIAKEALENFFLEVPAERRLRDTSIQRKGPPKMLIVVGGYVSNIMFNMEYYDFIEGNWCKIDDISTERKAVSAVLLDNKIYIVGGHQHCGDSNVYDITTRTWSSDVKLMIDRDYCKATILNNCIYAVGGCYLQGTAYFYSSFVLKYDFKTERWGRIANMLTKRAYHGVGVIDNVLYAVGGYACGTALKSVEFYNSLTNSWNEAPSMNVERKDVGVGVLNGVLYAVGGKSMFSQTENSAEAFDPYTNNWRLLPNMRYPRWGAAVVAINDLLYVIGGVNNLKTLANIEVYDPDLNMWTELPKCMNARHLRHTALVV